MRTNLGSIRSLNVVSYLFTGAGCIAVGYYFGAKEAAVLPPPLPAAWKVSSERQTAASKAAGASLNRGSAAVVTENAIASADDVRASARSEATLAPIEQLPDVAGIKLRLSRLGDNAERRAQTWRPKMGEQYLPFLKELGLEDDIARSYIDDLNHMMEVKFYVMGAQSMLEQERYKMIREVRVRLGDEKANQMIAWEEGTLRRLQEQELQNYLISKRVPFSDEHIAVIAATIEAERAFSPGVHAVVTGPFQDAVPPRGGSREQFLAILAADIAHLQKQGETVRDVLAAKQADPAAIDIAVNFYRDEVGRLRQRVGTVEGYVSPVPANAVMGTRIRGKELGEGGNTLSSPSLKKIGKQTK